LTPALSLIQYTIGDRKKTSGESKPNLCEVKMSDLPEEAGDARPKSAADQLNAIIQELSDSQQEYLLEVVRKWVRDQREYPRKNCQVDVIYSDNNRVAQGMIMNISDCGLYLQPDSPFAVGQDVVLTFEHPFTEKQVKVNGKIIRSDQKGIGVKFDRTMGNM